MLDGEARGVTSGESRVNECNGDIPPTDQPPGIAAQLLGWYALQPWELTSPEVHKARWRLRG